MSILPPFVEILLLTVPLLGLGLWLYFSQQNVEFQKSFDLFAALNAWQQVLYPAKSPVVYVSDAEDAGVGYGPTTIKAPLVSHSYWTSGKLHRGYMTFVNVPLGTLALLGQAPSNLASRILNTSQWCFFNSHEKSDETPITIYLLPQSLRWQFLLDPKDNTIRIGELKFKFHVSIHSFVDWHEGDARRDNAIAEAFISDLGTYRERLRGCVSNAINDFLSTLAASMADMRAEQVAKKFIASMPELTKFCNEAWAGATKEGPLSECLSCRISAIIPKFSHQILLNQYYLRTQQTDAIRTQIQKISNEINSVLSLEQKASDPLRMLQELLPRFDRNGETLKLDCVDTGEFLAKAQLEEAMLDNIVKPHEKSRADFNYLVERFETNCSRLAEAIKLAEAERQKLESSESSAKGDPL